MNQQDFKELLKVLNRIAIVLENGFYDDMKIVAEKISPNTKLPNQYGENIGENWIMWFLDYYFNRLKK